MHVENSSHNRESETRTTGITVTAVVSSEEAFEYFVAKFFWNTFTVVNDLNDCFAILGFEVNLDAGPLWRETAGVCEQVGKHLAQLACVTHNHEFLTAC